MKLPITITLIAGFTALASATPKGRVDANILDVGARTINTLEEARRAVIKFREKYKHTVAQNPDAIIEWTEVYPGAGATMKGFDANDAVMLKTIDELILDVDDLLTPFGDGVGSHWHQRNFAQGYGVNDLLYKIKEQMDRLKDAYDKQDNIKGSSKEELSAQFRNIMDQLSNLPTTYDKYSDPKAEPTQETLHDLLREAGFEVPKGSKTPSIEIDPMYRKITSIVLQMLALDAKHVRENLEEWKKHPDFRIEMLEDGVIVPETEEELDEIIAGSVEETLKWLETLHKFRHVADMTEDELDYFYSAMKKHNDLEQLHKLRDTAEDGLENMYRVMKKKTDQVKKGRENNQKKTNCKNDNKNENKEL